MSTGTASRGNGARIGEESRRPSESEIREMVEVFYVRVREDPMLGPVFESRIGDEWDAHLDRMVDFWSTILLATGRYRGDPVKVHRKVPGIEPAHFDRWLALFRQVVDQVFEPHRADDIHGRALRMRMVLERNLDAPS